MSNSANLNPKLRALARINRVEAADEDSDPKDSDADPTDNEDSDADDSENLGGDLPHMVPEEEDPAAEEIDEDDEAFTIDDVIKCFLRANPNPTDEQVHAFADLLDMSYEEFEAQIFKKFGEVIRQATSIGPSESADDVEVEEDSEDSDSEVDSLESEDEDDVELEADESLDVQDDIDMFVIAYLLFNPEPSDEQIHQLAFAVDLTREQMEERIYRMLANYLQVDDPNSEDTEDTEDTEEDSADDAEEDEEIDESNDSDQTDDQGE